MYLLKSAIAIITLLSIATTTTAQAQYETAPDPEHPEQHIVRGIVNKYLIQNDPSYRWFVVNQNGYKPDTATLNSFERAKNKVQFIVFGGTWCEDTQFILPKFFRLQEMSGVKDTVITFFTVNRAKKSLGSITDAFKITNVPTIIVMKDGKEMGRVVEYGKTGKWDKELGEILNGL
jgi:thiol-disulfide isomerase/thioredoxin